MGIWVKFSRWRAGRLHVFSGLTEQVRAEQLPLIRWHTVVLRQKRACFFFFWRLNLYFIWSDPGERAAAVLFIVADM